MQLTLLIPELVWPEPDDRDTLGALSSPALSTLLARSRRTAQPPQSLEATLTDQFGHRAGAPYGAFRRLGETGQSIEVDGEFWISADPVHLRFHQDRLILADSRTFGVTLEEAQALADGLNALFADIGRFHVATAGRWYLQLAKEAQFDYFDTPPLSAVAGRSIERLLPEVSQARAMRRLLNEIQTFLHASPVNQQRENAGRLSINSLWLWGAGRLPERVESDFDGVWSTDPLALGLARAAGVPTHPVPVDATTFFSHAAPETQQLVILDDLQGPVQYEDGAAYRQAIAALEERWFSPLQKALAVGQIKQLRIVATTAYATLNWESTRLDQWKLWQRPQPLATLAKTLAKTTEKSTT